MKRSNNLIQKQTESGQAMAEFVVIVATVFMALFIVVPQFGKIMDMQYQTQMAARYVAWERTVWFDSGDDPAETENSNVANRNDSLVENTMENRFFYGVGTQTIKSISNSDAGGASGNPSPLWTFDQSGNSMLDGVGVGASASNGGEGFELSDDRAPWATESGGSLKNMPTESIAYEGLGYINQGIGFVGDALDDVLDISGEGFLSINHDLRDKYRGYYRPGVVTRLDTGNAADDGHINIGDSDSPYESIESWIFQNWNGEFAYQSAILADGWNAASDDHFEKRTNDLVPSTVFSGGLITAVKDVIGTFEPNLNNLEFGSVETDPIPDADVDCFMGFCQFDED